MTWVRENAIIIVYRRVTPGLPATWESWNPEEPNA